jgi:hypothetical protein
MLQMPHEQHLLMGYALRNFGLSIGKTEDFDEIEEA